MSGWIKLHRKILKWEWWDDHNTTRLFLWMLLQGNHEPRRWMGRVINMGQFPSGLHKMSKETGLSIQQCRTSIDKLKATGEITSQSTNRFTVFTLEKWSDYQLQEPDATSESTSQATNKQQTNNNTQELKKIKKKRNSTFTAPDVDSFSAFCKEKGFEHIAQKAYDYYSAGDWQDARGRKIKNWKQKLISVWFDENKNPAPEQPKDGMEISIEEAMKIHDDVCTGYDGLSEAEQQERKRAREGLERIVGRGAEETISSYQDTIQDS